MCQVVSCSIDGVTTDMLIKLSKNNYINPLRVVYAYLYDKNAGIDLTQVKTNPVYLSTLKELRARWQRDNIDSIIKNQKLKEKILTTIAYVGYEYPIELKKNEELIFKNIHDLATSNQLTIFDKYNDTVTLKKILDDFRTIEHNKNNSVKLTNEEQKIYNRVKVIKNFEDGWQWVMAVDEQGNPSTHLSNSLCMKTMGHCGNSANPKEGDIYYELRQNNQPHLTVILDADSKIKESKGKNNELPRNKKEILHLVKWFMEQEHVKGVSYGMGHARDKNFGIIQFLEDDPEFVDKIERERPELIDSDADKPILDWKRKLKSGEVSEEDVYKAFDTDTFMLEHLRGILGRDPFTEMELIKLINSGRLATGEIGNADIKYLTPKVQDVLLDKDTEAPYALLIIKNQVPHAKIDVDKIFRKKPGAITEFPDGQRKDIHDAHVEAFDEVFRKDPDAISAFPKDQRKDIHDAHVEAFDEGFRKDPEVISYFPKDQRKDIHDAHVEAFDAWFRKDPGAITEFPDDQIKDIHDAHVEAFDEMFRKYPGVIKAFPDGQRKDIHDAHVEAFDEIFRKDPEVISYFPKDQRKDIHDAHVEAFDDLFRKYPGAIEYFPFDQRKDIHDAHVEAFDPWFRKDHGALYYFPEKLQEYIKKQHPTINWNDTKS